MNLGGQELRWAGPPAAHRSALFILSCHLAQPLKVPFHSSDLGLAFVDGPRADVGSGWSMAFCCRGGQGGEQAGHRETGPAAMRMAALPTWGLWHHCWVQWAPFLSPARSAEQEGAHLDQLGAQMGTHLLRPRQADPCTPPVLRR